MLLAIALCIAAPPDVPPACAWVRAENDGAGAGFVVDAEKKLLVTCRHVVADRKKVDVYFPWYRDGELVSDKREYLRNRPALREKKLLVTGTVLKTSDELDLALVELDSIPPSVRAVAFANRRAVAGDSLRVIGHRLDLDTVWNVTTGPLRTTGTLTDGYFWRGRKLAANAPAIIGQLPIEEGDSGGPVFGTRGEVVGLACALRRQCPLAAVAIPADAIRAFIGAKPVGAKAEPNPVVESLFRSTVWVRPTATELSLAGVLIEKDLVLTCARGLVARDRVGIAFPLRDGGRWVSERAAYRDPLTLHLKGAWRGGTVLARDPARDLALVRLDSPHEQIKPLTLATEIPKPGDALHAMSHPGGLEFAWVYSGGSVRQRGKIALDAGEKEQRVSVLVCQLPAQAGSPGGPILNTKGELVGVLSAREGAQMVGYAATTGEIRAFLDARIESLPQAFIAAAARGFAASAESHRKAGRLDEAKRDCDSALSLDPGCGAARLCRSRMLTGDAAIAELDAAIEKGAFDRGAMLLRAELAAGAKDWRKARGDLARVLDVNPADAEARLRLAAVHFALGDDAKAATAITDTLRADPKRLPALVSDLLAQAEALEQKYPDSPSTAVAWLTRALTAAEKGTSDAKAKAAIAETLKAARVTKSDAECLRVLRAGAKRLR